KALEAHRKSLSIMPSASAWGNIGWILKKQGRVREEDQAYREAIKLEPDSPSPYFNLGVCLSRQGRLREAEEVYRESLSKLNKYLASAGSPGGYLQTRRLELRLPGRLLPACNQPRL